MNSEKQKSFWSWLTVKLFDQRGEVGDGSGNDDPPIDPPASDDPPIDPPAVDSPSAPTTPQYASVEDLDKIKQSHQTLNDTLNQIKGSIEALNSRPSSAPSAPSQLVEDISDEQLEAALDSGKGAANFRKAWKADMQKTLSTLDEKISRLEQFGVNTLSEHGEQLAITQMPYRNNSRIKPLIDAELARTRKENPTLLSSPRIVKAIHDRVVGENIDVIIEDRVQEEIRKSREPVKPNQPTGRNNRQIPGNTDDEVPTVEQYFGNEAAESLYSKYDSPDDYAKSLRRGFKTWGEFVKWDKEERKKQTTRTSGRA